jgi:branched-chain amino acid transport system ATP-binding protein
MAFFSVQGLTKRFGGLVAVNNLSFSVDEGEILGLIGPNGSGKTTVFNLIMGVYHPSSGTIEFKGRILNGLPTWKICKLGIGRTFQITRPLRRMTVLENVMTGAFARTDSFEVAKEKAKEVLDFCGLGHKTHFLGKELTVADRKRLEIAKALATNPSLLLLDEVMAGLTPQEQMEGVELVKKIRNSGVTVIIVEHIMHVIMRLCDRILCINYGQAIACGSAEEVANHPQVIEAYLGKD